MKKLKALLPITLSVVMLFPNVVPAETYTQAAHTEEKVELATEINPYTISLPKRDYNDNIGSKTPMLRAPVLPASFLPGDPTAVKNQGQEGLCWAYSAAKNMEIATYTAEGSTNVLSPIQFANTFYKSGAVDQFNLTSGDRVINTSANNGSNDLYTVFASMTQATPTVQNNGTYANVTQHPIGAYFYDTSQISEVKEAIYKYGSCTIAVKSRDNANACWYETDPTYKTYNHAITLIGWQDSVSRSNFTDKDGGHPSKSGAFRFVNSWGTQTFGDQGGKGGYGWISYEDVTFTDADTNRALAYEMTTDWDVDNVYQNDGCYAYATRETSRCAEIFTTHGGTAHEKVQGAIIGLHSSGDYTAYVYRVQNNTEDLTDQVLLGKQDFSMPAGHYGYTTVFFDNDIVLSSGDTFAVAVTRKDGSNFNMLVDATATYAFVKFQPSSPAASYYFDSTKYSTVDNHAPRIKVLTKDLTSTSHTGTIDDYNVSLDYSRLMYTGEPQYPTITIHDLEGNLVSNDQFKFSYSNNINASRYAEVTISSLNPSITGTQRLNFTILPRPIDDVVTNRYYTGTANIKYSTFLSSLYLAYNRKVLTYKNDFTVTNPNTLLGYGDNQIVLYGMGNFNSNVTIIVQGTQNGVASDELRVSSFPNKIYTGKKITLQPNEYTIKYGSKTLVYGQDFRLNYENNINVGKAKVKFVGLGEYTGCSGDIGEFEIKPLNVNDCVIQTPSSVAYMNEAVTLVPNETITVFNADASVQIDPVNYTLDYTSNLGTGTMTVYVCGRNNLTGAVPCDVKITQARMENATITVDDVDYTGTAQTPKVTVTLDGKTLREDVDYTLRYTDNINPGKATVTVLGQYYIQGFKEATFNIKAPKITTAEVRNLETSYYYTGNPIEPDIKVVIGEKELTKGVDYFVRYENNKDIGKAYIHIIGNNEYEGSSKSVTFLILEDPDSKFKEYNPTLTSVSMDTIIKSKLEYEVPFDVEKVRTTNKKRATITKNGKINVKSKTGKVTLEVYGSEDSEVYAYTLNVIKPKFKKKTYKVKVGDTVKIDDIIDLHYILPSSYKVSSKKRAEVDEKERTITFTKKGTVKLTLKYQGVSYKPSVTFKISNSSVSNNQ